MANRQEMAFGMKGKAKVGSLREEHARSTRRAILAAARQVFTAKGYEAASIDEVARAARVTSGALYHHFRNKRDSMRAAFESVEAELKQRVVASATGAKTAMDAMRRSLRAF